MSIAALLSAGGSALSSFLGYLSNERTNEINRINVNNTNASNERMADRANMFNREMARETNETNQRIAMENLNYQRELQEYQKAIQQKQWEREDTSYQRTAQDMLAAGLNPLDMQGTNGAGEVVSMSPLENTFQAQQGAAEIASKNESFRQADSFSAAMQGASAIGSLAQMFNQIETGSLQRDSLELENDKKMLENIILQEEAGIVMRKDTKRFNKYKSNFVTRTDIFDDLAFGSYWNDKKRQKRELNHMIDSGKYDSDTDFERILTAISDWVNNGRGQEEWEKLKQTFPILKAFNMLGGN